MPRKPNSPQMAVGWVALAAFALAVASALLKIDIAGFVFVSIGGALSVVAMVLELMQRRAVRQRTSNGGAQVFSDTGEFGSRRSPQTHTPMM